MRRSSLVLLLLSAALAQAAPGFAFEACSSGASCRRKEPLAKVVADTSDSKQVFAVPLETLMSMHGQATVIDSTVYVKGAKVRADTTTRDGQSYYVMNLDSGVTQVVNPSQKQVTEIRPEDMRAAETKMASYRANRGNLSPRLKGTNPKDVLTREGLPMRVQTLNDRQYMIEDLVEIEAKPVSEDMFVVRADYSKSSPQEQMEKAGKPKRP